jgi:uncharacterized protein YndB with AHSA1/START domain
MSTPSPASGPDRALATARLIDAPRERVYRALADPAALARWWGPTGFTNTFHEFDLRPGGMWRFVMHGPDGTDYPNESTFTEVVPGERVVVRHLSAPHFDLTITFVDQGEGTLVGWHQAFDTPEMRDKIAKLVGDANEQNLDRLIAVVAAMA